MSESSISITCLQKATATVLRGCVCDKVKWVCAESMTYQWCLAYVTWVSCLPKTVLNWNSRIRYLTSPLVYLLLWAGKWLVPVTPLKQKATHLNFRSSFWVPKIRKMWQELLLFIWKLCSYFLLRWRVIN